MATHFFKFMPPGFPLNLSIPTSFWANFNCGRRSKAILRRGCREWAVEISDRGVFGDGWKDFVTDNGVEEFDFIVFDHKGNMVFDFWVFDQSSCERPFPNVFQKMDAKEPLTQSHPIHGLEKRKMHKRNDDIVYDDNRYFKIKMTPHYVKSSKLNVPLKFARSHRWITKRRQTKVIIRDERQHTWHATLNNHKTQIRLYGWHKISLKNHLKIGDTCMFEVVKLGEVPLFNLYNLGQNPVKNHTQVKKETSSTLNYDRCFNSTLKPQSFKKLVLNNKDKPPLINISFLERKRTNSQKKVKFEQNGGLSRNVENDHRYFIGELKSYSIEQSLLYLPHNFAKKNGLIKKGEMILINVEDERSWIVGLNHCMDRYSYIKRGWSDFHIANGLKEGDQYKFEVVKLGEVPVLNFYNLAKKLTGNHTQAKEATSTIKKETISSHNNHGYFISTLNACAVKKSILHLPIDFWRSNGLKIGKMILKDNKSRSWEVLIRKRVGSKSFYLGCGFRAFRIANELKEGDVFKFELVENRKRRPPIVNFSCMVT